MKRVLIIISIIVCAISSKAQFSNTDTLRSFINRWIRNSSVEAFQNLRMNTTLIGMTNFLDSSYGGQIKSITATTDTSFRIITVNDDTLNINIPGKATQLNDSSFIVGGDTIVIRGTGGAAGADSSTFSTNYRRDTAVSNVRTYIDSAKTYPAESSNLVTIYDKSAWTAADLGSEFQRGSNHTLSLNGSYPRIASSTIVWGGNSITRFLPNMPIIAKEDSIVMEYQIVSPNVGFGISFYSNNVNGANFGYTLYYGNSSSPGSTNLAKQDGTSSQTGTTIAWSTNDIIRQTMSFKDTALVATFQNLTTSSAITTITKSFTAGSAPYPPNTGTWAFQNFSGTYEIRRIKIMSRKTVSPTLMVAFDSKGQIITTSWGARFSSLLNARYPTVLNYSGGGDQLKDLIDKKIEFSRINPEQLYIGLGSNDLRYGASLATTLDRLDKVVKMIPPSTKWAVTVVPEDSTGGGTGAGIGLTAFKNAIASLYPDHYIDLWSFMSTSNVLKSTYNGGDGIHENTEGHRIIDSLTAATGFFSTQSTRRRTPYHSVAGGLFAIGDSLSGPFKTPFPINNIPKFNDSNQIVASLLFDNSSKLVASTNYQHAQSVAAGTLLHVDGGIATTGTGSVMYFYDRTNPSNFHAVYSNNNTLRFNYNGTDNNLMDNTGKFSIGSDATAATIYGSLRIRRSYTYGTISSLQGLAINVDSATYTTTAVGAQGNGAIVSIAPTTIIGPGSSSSYTNMSSFYIDDAPTAGANMTLTNKWAMYVKSGMSYFGNTISLNNITAPTSTYSVLVHGTDSLVHQTSVTSFSKNGSFVYVVDSAFSDISNSGTTETTIDSTNVGANTLTANGQAIEFEITGTYSDITASAQLKVYFAGNTLIDAGALPISSAPSTFHLKGHIIRTGTTTAKCYAELISPGTSSQPISMNNASLTGLDFTAANVFKFTAQASGAGGGTGDITGTDYRLSFTPTK